MIVKHAIDQADIQRFGGRHAPSGIGQLAHNALGYQLDDTRECADICRHANLGFINRDKSVSRRIAHIRRSGQIDAAANAAALNGDQNRQAALLEHGQRILHAFHRIEKFQPSLAFAMRIGGRVIGRVRTEHGNINPAAKMRAGGRHNNDPRLRVGVNLAHDLRQFFPKSRVHIISHFGAVHHNMGNAVGK